jgi:translation elongation factor EF-1beta
MYDVASELKIRREDFTDDLDEMEVCTIREQVVSVKWNYPVWEKNMLGFGLKQLETYKLWQKLSTVCEDFEKAKAPLLQGVFVFGKPSGQVR